MPWFIARGFILFFAHFDGGGVTVFLSRKMMLFLAGMERGGKGGHAFYVSGCFAAGDMLLMALAEGGRGFGACAVSGYGMAFQKGEDDGEGVGGFQYGAGQGDGEEDCRCAGGGTAGCVCEHAAGGVFGLPLAGAG